MGEEEKKGASGGVIAREAAGIEERAFAALRMTGFLLSEHEKAACWALGGQGGARLSPRPRFRMRT